MWMRSRIETSMGAGLSARLLTIKNSGKYGREASLQKLSNLYEIP
jgi:hypothetical protein